MKESPCWELELPLRQKLRLPWGQEALCLFSCGGSDLVASCFLVGSASPDLHKQVAHRGPDATT